MRKSVDVAVIRSTPPVMMGLAEAAAYLGISVRKLWSLGKDKKVKAARIGNRWIFKRAELDRFVDVLTAANA